MLQPTKPPGQGSSRHKNFLVILLNARWTRRHSSLAGYNTHCSLFCVTSRYVPSYPFRGFFPHTLTLNSTQMATLEEPFLEVSLPAALSSLLRCPLGSRLCLSRARRPLGLAWVPPPSTTAWTFSFSSKLGNWKNYLMCLLHLLLRNFLNPVVS